MDQPVNDQLGKYLLLFTIGLLLILVAPNLFSDGMFVDGVVYASLSKNLAFNIGEFWNLKYTETLYKQFNEHPPLAFGLQSLFFKLFGDHRWVERLYSFCTYFMVLLFMQRTWLLLGQRSSSFWVPALVLVTFPLMSWSISNNMLENTMSIFTIGAIYFYLLSTNGRAKYLLMFVSGVMIACAFLTKGLTGLYTWCFPFLLTIIYQKQGWIKAVLRSLLMVLFSVIPIALLFYFDPNSWEAMARYFDRQLLGSLANEVTVDSRAYIVTKWVTELLIPLGMILLLYWWVRKKGEVKLSDQNRRFALLFLLLGLCGVLPIMISLKQRGYYMVTTFPIFALSIAFFVSDMAAKLQEKVLVKHQKGLKITSYTFLLIGLLMAATFSNRVGKDHRKLEMISKFSQVIPLNTMVLVSSDLWSDWGLHAYFWRYRQVSLTDKKEDSPSYLLTMGTSDEVHVNSWRQGSYYLYKLK